MVLELKHAIVLVLMLKGSETSLLHVGVNISCYPGATVPTTDSSTWTSLINYPTFDPVSIYKSDIDPQLYGKTNGLIRRSAVGGSFAEDPSVPVWYQSYGSRCTYCSIFSTYGSGGRNLGIRGCNTAVLSWGRIT